MVRPVVEPWFGKVSTQLRQVGYPLVCAVGPVSLCRKDGDGRTRLTFVRGVIYDGILGAVR